MMAFDKHTGEEIWRALSSDWEPGYSQPIIIEAGGARQLIAWHPRDISSLDPETGEVYWEIRHIVDMGINPATAVHSGRYLFFTSQYGGARMLLLDDDRPGAEVLWEGVGESDPEYGFDFNTLNSVISTPLIQGDHVYGVDGHGVLRCLEAATGRRVWETEALIGESTNWATAFFVRNGDRWFVNTDTGDLVIARFSPDGYDEVRPHPAHRAHAPLREAAPLGPRRQLVAPRLREPPRRRPQRRGDRAALAGEGGVGWQGCAGSRRRSPEWSPRTGGEGSRPPAVRRAGLPVSRARHRDVGGQRFTARATTPRRAGSW